MLLLLHLCQKRLGKKQDYILVDKTDRQAINKLDGLFFIFQQGTQAPFYNLQIRDRI